VDVDALIVGGGLGGLSAAVCLAARGLSVEVLEGADAMGGKAGITVLDGVEVDTGPSLITLVDVIDGVFQDAGTRLRDEVELRVPEGGFELVFPDARVRLGHGLQGTLDGIGEGLGWRARSEAEAFLEYARVIWEEAAPAFVLGQAPGALSMLKLGPAKWMRLLKADPFRTMWDGIRAHVSDPRLLATFARFATYNGSDPRRAPATLNCIAWVELGLGGYGIEGGVHELARALVRVGQRLGVSFQTGARVARIDADGRGVRGVTLADGRRLSAPVVVCNADVNHLASTLLPGSVPPVRDPSTSGWTAIVRDTRRERPAHAVRFGARYEEEFVDLFDHRRPPQDPTVYVCAQEKAHGRAGWTDDEALFVMVNAPAGDGPLGEVGARALERLRAERWIQPDARVVWERTPSQLAARFPGSDGALYGAASNSPFAAFSRPSNAVPGVPGLYLASGSAHPGGGVPLVMQSGRMAAACVLRDRARGAA
jgi:1-hydroxycarotenoid 3,4-desaturase